MVVPLWSAVNSTDYSTRVNEAVDRSRQPELTIVVPTYNERERIGELVEAVFRACSGAGIELELVIVDDNSPDGTGEIADQLAERHRVRVIRRAGKLGLGSAVVAGFAIASAPVVGVMDADLSHPPALLPRMLATFKATGADIVVASRYVPGGSTPNWPMRRRILSRVACVLARPLTPIRDAASGFFLIARDIVSGVTIKAGGFKICLELLVRGRPRRLVEVPYQFDDRELGESKMSVGEAAGYLFQLWDLYRLRWTAGAVAGRDYRRLSSRTIDDLMRSTPAHPFRG
jgi:dolichol-phosphate mannosyltransferase